MVGMSRLVRPVLRWSFFKVTDAPEKKRGPSLRPLIGVVGADDVAGVVKSERDMR